MRHGAGEHKHIPGACLLASVASIANERLPLLLQVLANSSGVIFQCAARQTELKHIETKRCHVIEPPFSTLC
jgi:hypothetical protein